MHQEALLSTAADLVQDFWKILGLENIVEIFQKLRLQALELLNADEREKQWDLNKDNARWKRKEDENMMESFTDNFEVNSQNDDQTRRRHESQCLSTITDKKP